MVLLPNAVLASFLFSSLVNVKEKCHGPFFLPGDCWNLQVVPSWLFIFTQNESLPHCNLAPSCRLTLSQTHALPSTLPSREAPGGGKRTYTPQKSPGNCCPFLMWQMQKEHPTPSSWCAPLSEARDLVPVIINKKNILLHYFLFWGKFIFVPFHQRTNVCP